MSIPYIFDPMGTAGGGLPPGYERVQSVLKPEGAYWQTDIPVKTGMRMEADIMVTELGGPPSPLYFDLLNHINGTFRLQYLWGRGDNGVGKLTAARGSAGYTDIDTPLNKREVFIVSQYANSLSVLLKSTGAAWEQTGLEPYEVPNTKYELGHYTGVTTVYLRGAVRIYNLAMYEEGTNKCLFHFVPFRKLVNGAYSYGLYDVVNRKELPVKEGTIRA